ncbi:tRNA 2-thiocytidine biosynthesis TtcA family protein [Cuneatibacter caecimuris]|uniref:tRNA(Ile)-lysidine synthase TilS/MesJ n=1 Tax=Cuneatibacter caecimuris TaxID=1796618 RepID=A0A4Q7P060_9FIRM|nr:ATP-binding protein [Cuneatibacter caecimuris]RZS92917.1 tRNA(Ile)-lysidine synthase TilS/MesJ [Cuneatibacter caecimuris]
MKLQQLLSYARRAVDDYQMIQNGDKIAVGISGGKDSLALLYALQGLRRFYPNKFELFAITVDLGFPEFDLSEISKLCKELEVPYHIVSTQIGEIVFDVRRESNPCSLCAKMRKGAFNTKARELGCNKIAYAHHKDDVVETMLLSLIYEGRIHTFSPVTYLDRMQVTLIRPLIYVNESDIVGFQNLYRLPVRKNPCPADGKTKREFSSRLLSQLIRETPDAKEHIFSAIRKYPLKNWEK